MSKLFSIKTVADHAFFRLVAADTAEAAVAKYIAEDGEPGESIYAEKSVVAERAEDTYDIDAMPMFGGPKA